MLFPQSIAPLSVTHTALDDCGLLPLAAKLAGVRSRTEDAETYLARWLTSDAAELTHRRHTVSVLLTLPEAEAALSQLIALAERIRARLGRFRAERTIPYLACTVARLLLNDYTVMTDALRSLAQLGGDALAEDRAALERLLNSPAHRGAAEAAVRLAELLPAVSALDVGANVNSFFEIEDLGILGCLTREEPVGDLLSPDNARTACVAEGIAYPRTPDMLSLESHLAAACARTFKAQTAEAGKLLETVDLTAVADLAEQVSGLSLTLSALELARHWQSHGFPICLPETGDDFALTNAVDPAEALLGSELVPVSIRFARGQTVIITGANRSGKTAFLKTAGQCVLLAQLGFPLPCRAAQLPLFDDFRTLFSAGEENDSNKSRFQLELEAIRTMENSTGKNALILFNEPLTSTNPEEAVPILAEVMEDLSRLGSTQLCVTHFRPLCAALPASVGMRSFVTDTHMEGGRLCFAYTLTEGLPSPENLARLLLQQYGLSIPQILAEDDAAAVLGALEGGEPHA